MEWIGVFKDLNAGTIGGVAGIIAGYPMDTIKVHLQTKTVTNKSIVPLMKKIINADGVRGLYKGMMSPIISNAPINAVVFAVYGQASRMIQHHNNKQQLSPGENFIAGSLAGLLQTLFSSPSELVKIQLQVSTNAQNMSSIQYAKRLVRTYGIRRGLFNGWGITAIRDVPALGIYFSVYEMTKTHLRTGNESSTCDLLLAGGIAGTASWALIHPIDVVKSCIQSQSMKRPISVRYVIMKSLSEEGPRYFTKGFGATILRAFPVSAVTFVVYEKCIHEMTRHL